VDIDWTRELVNQLEFHWSGILRPRLDGLTDDVYLWEPVSGCWTIRAGVDGGAATIDYEWPEPVPPPVTTIAWRMGHIAVGVFGTRAANHFGDGGVTYEDTEWPLTAAGGLELLDRHHDAWVGGVRSLDAAALAGPCGPAEGPYAVEPFATLVLHINREALHHGAEIGLLLDLYEHRSPGGPP